MERALLDTDILSEMMRGKNSLVLSRGASYLANHRCFTFSMLSVLEVVKGLVKAGRGGRVDDFLQFAREHEILTLDLESAVLAGSIYAGLESRGTPIGRIDPIIAAIAVRHQLVLVTGNLEHYERVQSLGFSLALADWRQA
jgi:tRNA(fMet)-specific endonuclease VapC